MNPLHLSGYGVEILTSNPKPHAELKITVGRKTNPNPDRYQFLPRRIGYDSIILENATGQISLAALRWLSQHNIPIFFLDFDGAIISSILPPTPVKADIRAAQFQASNDAQRKLTIAKALVQAKIARSLQVLDWLGGRYDIEQEVRTTKAEAMNLSKASTVPETRTVEGRTALRYWETFRRILPEWLHFQGRMTTSHNNNASDPFNAALNYGYGSLKVECRMAVNSVPTLSSLAISDAFLSFPLYPMTEVRDTTLNSEILEMAEISSSVIPSAKYSSFGSGLMFRSGNTATRPRFSVDCVGENAGGMKLFDRPMSVGCKGCSLMFRVGQYRAFPLAKLRQEKWFCGSGALKSSSG